MKKIFALLLVLGLFFGCTFEPPVGNGPPAPIAPPVINLTSDSRNFLMGFTTWPPDFDAKAIDDMFNFNGKHSDLFVFHQTAGLPWQEAFEGKPFPNKMVSSWSDMKARIPQDHKIYFALSPLNELREGLANSYNESSDNVPLTAPWNSFALNDPAVKTAYLNYAKKVVEEFDPDYLAIGIEANLLINKGENKWQEYLELHKFVYSELKKTYPDLLVFASIEYVDLKGLTSGSRGKESLHIQGAKDLMESSDVLGISTYPYAFWFTQKPVPQDFFDLAVQISDETRKPIAITETGYSSDTFNAFGATYSSTEEDQFQYLELLFKKANEHKFLFIVNWAGIDFDKLTKKFFPGSAQDFSWLWTYTGIQRSNGNPKKAYYLWDAYLNLPRENQ